jgi:hypothetical protein
MASSDSTSSAAAAAAAAFSFFFCLCAAFLDKVDETAAFGLFVCEDTEAFAF